MHHKARLVVKGCASKHGFDFNDTFVPIVKFISIRMLLAITIIQDLGVYQVDFKSSFLNGDFETKFKDLVPKIGQFSFGKWVL
jgi:hypothetical protein